MMKEEEKKYGTLLVYLKSAIIINMIDVHVDSHLKIYNDIMEDVPSIVVVNRKKKTVMVVTSEIAAVEWSPPLDINIQKNKKR